MMRKEYQKPAMQTVTLAYRSGLLARSVEGVEGDAGIDNYKRRNTEDW